MLAQPASTQTRSPLAAALLICFSVAAGTVFTTLDSPIFDEITSGRWLTGAFSQAQERNTSSIANLERNVGALTTDIDFVAGRMHASAKRSDDLALVRFTQIDAALAAMDEKIAKLQLDRLVSSPVAAKTEDGGLRSSLHELAAHSSALTAITKRLDRIEVKVGMSTDTDAEPVARHAARRKATAARKPAQTEQSPDLMAQTERLLGLRPAGKPNKSLRVSTLRD